MSNRKDRHGIIYRLHCIPENKDYVGQTRRTFKKRWNEHCTAVELYKDTGNYISLVDWKIYEYGANAFETEILERPTVKDLNERERYWVAKIGSREPNGYNRTDGGGANGHLNWSDEDIAHIGSRYCSGVSISSLASEYQCSPASISSLLQATGITLRTIEEIDDQKRKHTYYRLSENGDVLETYRTFSDIGRWAKQEGLAEPGVSDGVAGLPARYAILHGLTWQGFRWDASWTSEEREERIQRNKSKKKRKKNPSNEQTRQKKLAPHRSISDDQLYELYTTMTIVGAARKLGVSAATYKQWLRDMGLPVGHDERALFLNEKGMALPKRERRSKHTIAKEQLLAAFIEYDTLQDAAKSLGVSVQTYARYLKKSNLPTTSKELRSLVEKKLGIEKGSPYKRPSKMPSRKELASEIRNGNFTKVGEKYGVSGSAVKKWCRKLELPDSSTLIRRISDDKWDEVCENWNSVKDVYGQKKEHRPWTNEEKQVVVRLYSEGRTVKDVAAAMNRGEDSVRKHLVETGVEIDLFPGAVKLYCPELEVFAERTRDMAAILFKHGIVRENIPIDTVMKMISRVVTGRAKSYCGLTFKKMDE